MNFCHMPWLAARASGLPKIVFRDRLIFLISVFSKGFPSSAAFGQPARGERRARLVHNRSPATRLGFRSADDGWGTRHGRAISGPAERRSDRRRGSAEPAVGSAYFKDFAGKVGSCPPMSLAARSAMMCEAFFPWSPARADAMKLCGRRATAS